MPVKLKLNNGGYTLVDDEDFEWLSIWKWTRDGHGYALRFYGPRSNQKQVRMHRAIMAAPVDMQVDHINGDTLDNRRSNLRLCTNSQNKMNTKRRVDNKSGFKGVTLHKATGLYMARLKKNGRLVHCTYHKTAEKAAEAYRFAAMEHHGEFAKV